jgi:ribonuclease D
MFRLKRTGIPDYILKIFEDKNIVKAGVDLKRDILELKDYQEFNAQSIVDLNKMASDLGFENVGAKKLMGMLFNHRISKGQQTSNWETPNLSRKQIIYAATDAYISRMIYVKLNSLKSAH